jgi:hypothetical protein
MIEATRRKLDEARFFYGHLVEERPDTMKAFGHDQRAFRYYFSAFIQAARSVTWTLGNEEPKKWKAWEPTWKRSKEEDDLLKLTNKLRLDEAKRGGANALIVWEEVALHELLALRSESVEPWKQHPAYGVHVFAPPGVPSPKIKRPAYYFEQEDGKHEVTVVCQRYLEFLEKTLNDFCADNQSGV